MDRGWRRVKAAVAIPVVAILAPLLGPAPLVASPGGSAAGGMPTSSDGDAVPNSALIPDDRITASDFELIGGWRVPQPFCRGGLAIDWKARRVFVGGHAQKDEIHEYPLPPMGKESDLDQWPIVERVATHEKFWDRGHAGALDIRDGVLWVSPRVFYDMKPQPLTLYGKDLATGEIRTQSTALSQPGFGGGFVKGADRWLIGCGGYESGQGSRAGPTLATADGTVLMDRANHGTMVFEERERRPPNYIVEKDTWLGLAPRNGVGRWAADRVYAGGVWRPRGLLYWAVLGVGKLDYARQSETFGETIEDWLYSYDPKDFNNVAFTRWPYGTVLGHEVDAGGRVYLLIRNQWKSLEYQTDPAIKVFQIKRANPAEKTMAVWGPRPEYGYRPPIVERSVAFP